MTVTPAMGRSIIPTHHRACGALHDGIRILDGLTPWWLWWWWWSSSSSSSSSSSGGGGVVGRVAGA
eukprot:3348279-Prymnesium_polylepis.1